MGMLLAAMRWHREILAQPTTTLSNSPSSTSLIGSLAANPVSRQVCSVWRLIAPYLPPILWVLVPWYYHWATGTLLVSIPWIRYNQAPLTFFQAPSQAGPKLRGNIGLESRSLAFVHIGRATPSTHVANDFVDLVARRWRWRPPLLVVNVGKEGSELLLSFTLY